MDRSQEGGAVPKGWSPRHFVAGGYGCITAMLGCVVLIGWVIDSHDIKSVLPGAVEMKANTALCLLAAGLSLALQARTAPGQAHAGPRGSRLLAAAVALVGLATLGEYLFGWQLGIDELLFQDTANAYNPARGRMSPYSAIAFTALGTALALPRRASLRWLAWPLTGAALVIGTLSLLGYLWGAVESSPTCCCHPWRCTPRWLSCCWRSGPPRS